MTTPHTDHPHLRALIRKVPNFPKPGIEFLDIMPIFKSYNARRSAFALMQTAVEDLKVKVIVGLESRGLMVGLGMADRMQLGFVPVRKKGKLPPPVISESYGLEYGHDTVELSEDSIEEGDEVLVVDDLLATGGSAKAACELVKRKKAKIVAVVVLIELTAMNGRAAIEASFPGTPVRSVLRY